MALAGVAALYRNHIRPWMYRWGATAEEVATSLPEDEIVVAGAARTTRAITIDDSVERVWQWLAQIGEDRAGFYGYSLLERAFGADIHNSRTVHPEWQELQAGDTVWLARRYGDFGVQRVAAVVPKSHLVLVSELDYDRLQNGEPVSGSWAFHLRPQGRGTRMLVRGSGGAVGHAFFDMAHFVMEQKMMRGIRHRAEHSC
jgi:hypothetical protein